MSDILVNVSNDGYDVSLDNGDFNLCQSYIESVEQAGYIAIMTRKGDNIFHDTLGNDLWNKRVKIAQSESSIITEYCTEAVFSSDESINNIETLDVYINDDYPNNISTTLHINESDIEYGSPDDHEEEEDGEEYGITE